MRSFATGPVITTGNVDSLQNREPEQGPSPCFQGSAVLDPRYVGQIGQAPTLQQPVYSLFESHYIGLKDGVPQALAAANIAAAQAPTSGTPLTLANAQAAGISINIPLVPNSVGVPKVIATPNVVTPRICLDMGFTTGSGTSGNKTITIPAGAFKFFVAGQPLCIAHGKSATAPLFTTVAVTPTGTTLTINDALGATVTNTQIGNADPSQLGTNIGAGIVHWPWQMAGGICLSDPRQALARAVSITGNAGSLANVCTVVGFDVWGNPQTEAISFAGGAVTTNGKKAFKWITSVTPATTDGGHTISCGTTDIFGLSLASDFWEYMNVYWNGAFVSVSTGWTGADRATPTATTGDTRGTYAVQSASDGSKRLAAFLSVPMYNMINANNMSFASLFGNVPFG